MDQPTIPNTGRILDYWLGGQHHFAPDVGAAQAFQGIYADFPNVFKILRSFIGRATRSMADQDINQFIVFGAGIPTQGNVHEAVPDAKVLYTDIDPVNIELGQQILANQPNAGYTYCDAANLATLDQAVVQQVLGPLKRVGIVFVGVAAFLPDEQIKATFAQLYDWAPGESYLTFDFDSTAIPQHLPAAAAALAAGGSPFYGRTADQIPPLLDRWQLTDDEIKPAEEWRQQVPKLHEPVFMFGGVARKPPTR